MTKDDLKPVNKKALYENLEVPHILVIRLSAMGDVAMTVPVLRVVRETYPDVKITVLTRKFFEPIFDSIQNIDVFHADVSGDHKGVIGLAKLSKELRKLGITRVADLHNVLRSNVLKHFFQFRGIKVEQIDKGRKEKKSLTRVKNKNFRQLKTTHQRYADVFSDLGYPIDIENHHFPEKKVLSQQVLELTKNNTKKWLGIAPFAQYDGKTYPLELMIEVIKKLDTKDTFNIFLFGGGTREIDILSTIASNHKNVISVVGKLSFVDELILISNLHGMISMDSGNAHLAAMYGVPTITLWGVTHPFAGFFPFGQSIEKGILPDLTKYNQIPTSIYGHKVPEGYEKVMRTIDPDTVVEAACRL